MSRNKFFPTVFFFFSAWFGFLQGSDLPPNEFFQKITTPLSPHFLGRHTETSSLKEDIEKKPVVMSGYPLAHFYDDLSEEEKDEFLNFSYLCAFRPDLLNVDSYPADKQEEIKNHFEEVAKEAQKAQKSQLKTLMNDENLFDSRLSRSSYFKTLIFHYPDFLILEKNDQFFLHDYFQDNKPGGAVSYWDIVFDFIDNFSKKYEKIDKTYFKSRSKKGLYYIYNIDGYDFMPENFSVTEEVALEIKKNLIQMKRNSDETFLDYCLRCALESPPSSFRAFLKLFADHQLIEYTDSVETFFTQQKENLKGTIPLLFYKELEKKILYPDYDFEDHTDFYQKKYPEYYIPDGKGGYLLPPDEDGEQQNNIEGNFSTKVGLGLFFTVAGACILYKFKRVFFGKKTQKPIEAKIEIKIEVEKKKEEQTVQ